MRTALTESTYDRMRNAEFIGYIKRYFTIQSKVEAILYEAG